MADTKLTALTENTNPASTDILYMVDDPGGSPLSQKVQIGTLLTSGTYTPTLTNTTNLAASTSYLCQYLRVLDVIVVSGHLDVDPTAAGACLLGVSLPVASAFTLTGQCGGTAANDDVAGFCITISADATNDRASFQWIATDTANRAIYFSFTYRVV